MAVNMPLHWQPKFSMPIILIKWGIIQKNHCILDFALL